MDLEYKVKVVFLIVNVVVLISSIFLKDIKVKNAVRTGVAIALIMFSIFSLLKLI
ncbi:hypothetical protein [Parvimonas micra]|uniref:Histidine kinase n=1 Tax=Parvimonas micra TaxID=33033 RepID=A0AAX3K678_9FIRM|nr:hypothetical protein [Parvimonas micra]WBB30707.1 hypothetical protein NM222_07085 [Parvimonas micra]